MTREQAIALARQGYAEFPELFHKLRPVERRGVWIVQVWITPIFGWTVNSIESLRSGLEEVMEASSRWGQENAACQ